ncbi:LD-carboxypeptidase [Candidatus Saccharibacteria bacterium]|nr:LD-carboxypeptidase [Candidatus Saccharibacteria bacterium]MBH1973430.1 LD-carboxypeptidase [Candidatus Saccharibacteria bacterium]MBH1990329.1 LD-carboxypeptidase [Candidatus Saccharibacteria bacterium]
MKQFVKLSKLNKGDQVAVISPSNGLPQIFPHPYELGLERLQDVFGLTAKEYPTTRIMGAPLKDRARDIMDAFADKNNKAVFTSIGGEDQLQLIKYLDPQVFLDNPKPFFGYSDNSHLHNFLWNLGIPSYYGCAVMTNLGMNVEMFPMTVDALNRALFTGGDYEVVASKEYNDIGLDWSDKANLDIPRTMEPNEGLFWDGDGNVEGILWGGCVESLIFQSTAGKYLPKDEDLEGVVLFIETAEDIPEAWIPSYLLRGFGERGWFDKIKAVLVGRPKAWEFDKQNNTEKKRAYREEQRQEIIRSVRQYNSTIPIIQNLDFGHTDPQIILPNGGNVKIDTDSKTITLGL